MPSRVVFRAASFCLQIAVNGGWSAFISGRLVAQGLRIDYALCSKGLLGNVVSCEVLDSPRKWCVTQSLYSFEPVSLKHTLPMQCVPIVFFCTEPQVAKKCRFFRPVLDLCSFEERHNTDSWSTFGHWVAWYLPLCICSLESRISCATHGWLVLHFFGITLLEWSWFLQTICWPCFVVLVCLRFRSDHAALMLGKLTQRWPLSAYDWLPLSHINCCLFERKIWLWKRHLNYRRRPESERLGLKTLGSNITKT